MKEQLNLGMSPVEIEREKRVELRMEHLGYGSEEATSLASEVKAAPQDARKPFRRDAANPALERIIGRDDLVSSTFLERGAAAASSVCCIRLDGTRIGTGFLVGPRLLLTNAHVIPSREEAWELHGRVRFRGFQGG